MAAVAEGAVTGGAAVAEVNGFRGVELEDVGCLACGLVAAIAEGPALAQTTGAEGMGAGGEIVGNGMGSSGHQNGRQVQASERPSDRALGTRMNASTHFKVGLLPRRKP